MELLPECPAGSKNDSDYIITIAVCVTKMWPVAYRTWPVSSLRRTCDILNTGFRPPS